MSAQVVIKGPQRTEVVKAWNNQIDVQVKIAGSGPALVYLHPAAGLYWDQFLDKLAETHTVYAPEMPGTSFGDPYAIHKVDTFLDLVLIYEEVLRKLGLKRPVAIGQSFGGMLMCDLAAHFPDIFSKIIPLDPAGLWRDDVPVLTNQLYLDKPENLPGYLFLDPSIPAAQAMFTPPSDPEMMVKHIAHMVWSLGAVAKFIWPFPDQGLVKRIHRISVPTLIIWGKQDKLIPVAYAEEFQKRIANSRVEIIDQSGHIPQMEQLDKTLALVKAFIAS